MSKRSAADLEGHSSQSKRRKERDDNPEPKILANTDCTVGWICALATEQTAALAFLDERFVPESVPQNDSNSYTIGRIGRHNIVIAVLPDGEYGLVSAANVANNMARSFPNVKIGLMVGIGGGVPTIHDIRLGDIVVSSPGNGLGGVLQYDFGKTVQNTKFEITGMLNQPPTVIRTAVNKLKSIYELEGHQLEEAINGVLQQRPRLRKKYQRPQDSTDRLYKTEFIHPSNTNTNEKCETSCGNNLARLRIRNPRSEDDDNPMIHYGLIASANQLLKDAERRDELAKEKDVLCFEMEAAGLMNNFPCLVIRGICDYSDSHKNKEWQGYAAMAAAAYATDLLRQIHPHHIQAEKNIIDILQNGQLPR